MGLPFSGPVTNSGTCCEPIPGTQAPDLAPYVRSIESLQGIINLGDSGAVQWRTEGNTIYADLTAESGLGSVTSVGIGSTTLSVSGSPVTTFGTITVNLTGAVASIQGLTTAADKMIYTTASNVYAVTDLTAFARTILDDANGASVLATIGAQPLSSDLTSFVTHATWTGANLSLAGNINAVNGGFSGDVTASGTGNFNDLSIVAAVLADSGTFTATVAAAGFSGDGSALTNLDAADIANGTLVAARGGTGNSSYAVGDLLYASGAGALSKLADVSAGSFLRSGGVATAPAWSTLKLPNAATTGDLLYASASNTISALADVATGNALISGGVGTAPSWGKITASHSTGLAASGANNDITALAALTEVSSSPTFSGSVTLEGILYDGNDYEGDNDALLTTTTTGTEWSRNINVDAFRIDVSLSTEGTITGAGVTGNQTINKLSGTVRVAAAATSVVVTNSLCSTSSRVLAMVSTNDSTAYVKNVVPASGSFTITLGAGATAETEIAFLVFNIT